MFSKISFGRTKIMVNMMTDLLYYLPYFLIVGAAFLLLSTGVIYTIKYFTNPRNIIKGQRF